MSESATRDSIQHIWGPRAPYHGEGEWSARVDQRVIEEPDRWVQSCCVLCSNGCGLDIGVKDGKIVGVRGRADDHVSRGRLGPKGLHGWMANNSPDRLTQPLVRRQGKLEPASWEEAMGLIVEHSKETIDRYTGKAMAFYGTGQLFIEAYHTITMIAKAGVRTPHNDGNTRLCTATAASALQHTFGSDGQPASYADVDLCDTLLVCGHNVSATQTVLFSRILDRLAGPNPPKLVVIDPRTTETARHAAVHLRPRAGTNQAVLNGLIHLIIEGGQTDRAFVDRHTVGFEQLMETTASYTPEHVEQISGISAETLREAARVLGTAERLLATVLQGFYQSNQATAASVQVNNLVLIRGMIGKPGCGVLQMNGQPTAQNTRECGADGGYAAFYNYQNPKHMEALADAYNIEKEWLPTYQPTTDIMQIMRYCELGSIKFLWIIATNPAVSLPELARVRRILARSELFVVINDAFPTETTELADVVLPAAIWGEKTGTFTNADRTVHISHKAVEPPGEARSDFDIFVDYARRMGFVDRDGAPLIKFQTPEDSFNHFAQMTRGRLCDYSGLSYEKLSNTSGIRWPCNDEHPDGAERLYTDFDFQTGYEECQTWGHDLSTGASTSPEEYRANDPAGRAILRAADYSPPVETPDEEYPLWLTTGRIVYHFHTRTKTGRSKALYDQAPEAFAQMHADDAEELGIAEGDWVEIESRRGKIVVPARIGEIGREGKSYDILPGHVFVPFHYGYWDEPGHPRAANELTVSSWDPISKQPHFKYAAVRMRKTEGVQGAGTLSSNGAVAKAVQDAGKAVREAGQTVRDAGQAAMSAGQAALGIDRSGRKIDHYVGLLRNSEEQLRDAFLEVAEEHPREAEIRSGTVEFVGWIDRHLETLDTLADRFQESDDSGPRRLREAMFHGRRTGTLGLTRDLHDLWLLAQNARLGWLALSQVVQALEETELVKACKQSKSESVRIAEWCHTQFKSHIAQALLMG